MAVALACVPAVSAPVSSRAPSAPTQTWQAIQKVAPPPDLLAKAWKPFTVPEDQASHTYHVKGSSPQAADDNPGTEQRPLKTVARAAALAMERKKQNLGTRILAHPGIYRETVELSVDTKAEDEPGAHDTDAPIVIEAAERGKAVLCGSDIWTGWKPEGRGVYSLPWPYKWGFVYNPWQQYDVDFPMRERRREQVLVDGRPLLIVLKREELAPGRFFVSEEEQRIWICPPSGKTPARSVIEVGTRDCVFAARGVRNLVVRGLVFRYSASVLYNHSVGFYKTRGLVVEDCISEWHNRNGLVVHMCDNTILRRLTLNHNGNGNAIGFCRNLLLEDVDTSYNNWRGDWSGWHGWEVCGIKAMFCHGVLFRRHRAVDNQTGGLWLDTDTENMVMEDCEWSRDDGGLGLENNQGPIAIVNCTMAHNRSSGITIDKSENGVLAGCTIVGNTGAQINVGGPPVASFTNWETKQALKTSCRNWVFERNVVATDATGIFWGQTGDNNYLTPRAAGALLCMPQWDTFLVTLTSRGNLWYHPLAAPFQVGSLATGELIVGLTPDEWRGLAGQDLDSVFADPQFFDMRRGDFRLRPTSPAFRWEQRPPLGPERLAQIRGDMGFRLQKYAGRLRRLHAPPDPGAFPRAATVRDQDWQPVDISAALNRPLTGADGWIGMPLDRVSPGRHVFAGIPFAIADPAQHGGMGAVALRSASITKTLSREAPASVEVPVNRKAAAVYILHGAGWVKEHGRIGRYVLVFEDGTTSEVPVVAYGPEAATPDQSDRQRIASNIQDWWPTAAQFSNDRARFVVIPDPNGMPEGNRYLYVLEWPNPRPEQTIRALRMSGEPAVSGSLLVLAVALLTTGLR
jgi:parallel beta-helix repeat protein